MNLMTTDDVAVRIQCDYCGARPGEWCRSRITNKRSSWLHSARTHIVHDAWSLGYHAAQEGRRYEIEEKVKGELALQLEMARAQLQREGVTTDV